MKSREAHEKLLLGFDKVKEQMFFWMRVDLYESK
jgi:hypothetical protein